MLLRVNFKISFCKILNFQIWNRGNKIAALVVQLLVPVYSSCLFQGFPSLKSSCTNALLSRQPDIVSFRFFILIYRSLFSNFLFVPTYKTAYFLFENLNYFLLNFHREIQRLSLNVNSPNHGIFEMGGSYEFRIELVMRMF